MNKLGLVLILAVVAIGAFLLLRPGDRRSIDDASDDDAGMSSGGSRAPASLKPLETGGMSDARTKRVPSDEGAESPSPTEGDDRFTSSIEVLVVDDETAIPIENAVVSLMPSGSRPCPPMIDASMLRDSVAARSLGGPRDHPAIGHEGGTTDKQGRFTSPWTNDPADLVVRKKGFILAATCAAKPGGTTTVRLTRGLAIEGVVVDLNDRPIEGVKVDAAPPRGIAATPGRRERAVTGADGAFAVEGLLAGGYDLLFTHAKFMPETRPGVATGKRGLRVPMRPGFFVTFKITTDNQLPPDSPTVGWTVPGAPPWQGLEMLRPVEFSISASGGQPVEMPEDGSRPEPPEDGKPAEPPPAGTFVYRAVPIPAGRSSAIFTVKAIGMEIWTSPPVDVPAEGGSTSIDVPLRRDPDLGTAKVAVESEDHRPLSFVGEKCTLTSVGRFDAKNVGAGVVYERNEAFVARGLASGRYRFGIASRLHAPATITLDVPPGGQAEGVVTLRPPAKLKIRATAPEAAVVRIQLLSGREIVWPFIESTNVAIRPGASSASGTNAPAPPAGSDGDGQDEAGGNEQSIPSGGDGLLLTGLPPGRVSVEILSPEWTIPPTSVDLVEGETKELELSVSRK